MEENCWRCAFRFVKNERSGKVEWKYQKKKMKKKNERTGSVIYERQSDQIMAKNQRTPISMNELWMAYPFEVDRYPMIIINRVFVTKCQMKFSLTNEYKFTHQQKVMNDSKKERRRYRLIFAKKVYTIFYKIFSQLAIFTANSTRPLCIN